MSRPLTMIAAVGSNGCIGVDGDLPWRLSEDLKHFRRNTVGHAVIMGRRTWDSIGRPLPKRRNIVVTRQLALRIEGAEVVHSLEEALQLAYEGDEDPRIIGGATLYAEALPLATRLLLTEVDQAPEGDTFFPDLGPDWQQTAREAHDGFAFVTWERG